MWGGLSDVTQGLDRLVFASLVLVLICLPLPFGCAPLLAQKLFCLVVFGLLGFWFLALGLGHQPRNLKVWPLLGIGLIWIVWTGWIVLQSSDISAQWVARYSPHRYELESNLAIISKTLTGTAFSLSLDAAATRSMALLTAGYFSLFLLVALCVRGRKRSRLFLWALVISGVVQAIYGTLMVLSGLEYGAWGPKEAFRGYATGTFVNRNHFAGYLEMSLAAALGLIVSSSVLGPKATDWRQRLRKWLAAFQSEAMMARVCVGLLFIGLLMSQSRMGNFSAISALGVAGLLYLLLRRRSERAWWMLVMLGSILVLDVWVIGQWFGLEQLAERYAESEKSLGARVNPWPALQAMIQTYYWTGSGLGTFMVAFPEFRPEGLSGLLDHAHNDYAQFIIEAGVPAASVLALLVILTALRALLILYQRHEPTARGLAFAAIMAITALALHSVLDFNLQIPANAATLVALMGAVWGCRSDSRAKRHAATSS